MKNINQLMVVILMLITTISCENNTPELAPKIAETEEATSIKEVNSSARIAGGGLILNAKKIGSYEKVISTSDWGPNPVFRVSSTYTYTTAAVKMSEISANISANVCTAANLKLLVVQGCAEASASQSLSNSQSATVSKTFKLLPYQQYRYVVKAHYDRFTATYKSVGTTPIIQVSVTMDIPTATYFADFEPRIVR